MCHGRSDDKFCLSEDATDCIMLEIQIPGYIFGSDYTRGT